MKVIIYGKDGCINCDKAKMLCRIRALEFQYLSVGSDISVIELAERVGRAIKSLPQIFLDRGDVLEYVGGYDDLRLAPAVASDALGASGASGA